MKLLVLALLLMTSYVPTRAQIVVEAHLDTASILVGEQVQLSVKCITDSHKRVLFPVFKATQEITPGVEVLNNGRIDTLFTNGGKRMELTRKYTITAFDSALYTIPPLTVHVDGKSYSSHGNLGLKVNTIDVDTVHVDKFSGPHYVVNPPFEWSWRLTVLLILLWGLACGALALCIRLSDPRLITRKVIIHPPVPAHVIALSSIDKIKKGQEPVDAKAYYTTLTEILRKYIEQRFGFNALEMTTSEISRHLYEHGDCSALAELKEVLVTADLVKFAKHATSLSEQDHNLVQALDFVQQTQEPLQNMPKPRVEYVTLSAGHQRAAHIAMVAGAWTLSLTSILLTLYIAWDIYRCFL